MSSFELSTYTLESVWLVCCDGCHRSCDFRM